MPPPRIKIDLDWPVIIPVDVGGVFESSSSEFFVSGFDLRRIIFGANGGNAPDADFVMRGGISHSAWGIAD